ITSSTSGRDLEHPRLRRVFPFCLAPARAIMAETVELVAQKRDDRGTKKARRLRKKGLIPGVVYGHKEATISISLTADDLLNAIRHGARVVDLKADGATEKALIREVQWDHLGLEILHVDFAHVAVDERITVPVPIELKGVCPGVIAGGILDQPIHSL